MPSITSTLTVSELPRQGTIDTVYRVETPEGIDLPLHPAGIIARSLAFAIDLVIRYAIMLILALIMIFLSKLGIGLVMLGLFIINWWYMVLFEVLNQGRSPGKHIMGLRVVHDDGTPIGWSASLIRNLLRFIDSLPFSYSVGLICSLLNPSFKRLGDIAAGTLVVYQTTMSKTPKLPETEACRPPFALTQEEQAAIQNFAERQDSLSASRREELAGILAEPLHTTPQQAEHQINAIARGLMGGQQELP